MVHLGIDPGLTGALAVLPDEGAIRFVDTPVTVIKSGKKLRRMMDAPAIALILQGIMEQYEESLFAVIEKVSPMPSTHEEDKGAAMGVTSAFNYGKGLGIWIGLIAGMQIPYEEVHPARWKAAILRDMGKGKDASRVKAVQLYPETASQLNLVKHHGRADALLMARYGQMLQAQFKPQKKEELAATLF